jgi:hypothetical protein
MRVVEPAFHKRGAGESVDVQPRVPGGKAQHRNADHALQHEREALAHLVGRRADGDGAGDVGGAVLILRAGIDQKELAVAERRLVASRRDSG